MKNDAQFLLFSAVFLHVRFVLFRQSLILTERCLLIICKQVKIPSTSGNHTATHIYAIALMTISTFNWVTVGPPVIAGVVYFTGRMLFVMPNEQCQTLLAQPCNYYNNNNNYNNNKKHTQITILSKVPAATTHKSNLYGGVNKSALSNT